MRLNSFMSWIGGKKALRELIVTLFPVYEGPGEVNPAMPTILME